MLFLSTVKFAHAFVHSQSWLCFLWNCSLNHACFLFQIWDAIKDGTIYSAPSLLSSYFVVSYADLKKYRFTYWFAFPALHSEPQWKRTGPIGRLTSLESTALVDSIGTWRVSRDSREHGFFLLKKLHGIDSIFDKGDSVGALAAEPEEVGSIIDKKVRKKNDLSEATMGCSWEVGRLGDFEGGFFKDVAEEDQYIAFVDPSIFPENPGWPLRNLLVLLRQRFHIKKAQILCFRDTHARRHEARSIILPLTMDHVDDDKMETAEMPRVTGWERSPSGRLSARATNLAEFLDPKRLADTSVDLNLKLMKWRIAPTLNLDIIKHAKCLLLGAGTLGGYVSRNLLGWGVRHITFVDNGAVSFSNPVRQPLFQYNDCLDGGKPKAIRSAHVLAEIYPGVESTGHVISIPMLGHPITEKEKTKSDFLRLQRLIHDHDVIFLLTDTRESRWLPTVMGKAHDKLVLNAALGFESYLVMRHGAKPVGTNKKTLGCYFCNDVVAPGDSVKDLTLDQQCTVTRPGVSNIASALLVELFVSVLQHPLRHDAPAPKTGPETATSYPRDPPDHPLGMVPHQIRGFLGSFQNMVLRGENYPCCSACSMPVLDAYAKDGWDFVEKALNETDYIPELSGLAEMQRQTEKMLANEEWSEQEEGDVDEGEGELI